MRIPSGITDQVVYFIAVDSTDLETRETGLTSFTVYRDRNGGGATAMTTPTVTEVDATNLPGVYKLLCDEDMTIGSGNDSEEMVFHITQASMAPVTRTIEIYRRTVTAGYTLGVAADGDISGNVDGAVASVVGAVGSVTADVTTDAASRTASQADVSGLSTFDPATDTVANVTTVAALTGHTAQTGDSYLGATAHAAIVSQYDGTGITGDTYPSTQAALANLSTSSSAISTRATSGTVNVGVEVGGTDYTNTYTKDGTFHTFTEDVSGNMDAEYVFELGGNGIGSEVVMDVYVSGNGDSIAIQAYNETGAIWETVDTVIASPGTEVVEARVPLDVLHTGIGSNAGKVRVRAYENAGGLSSVEVNIDKARIDYAVVAESVGYAQGRVWINTDAANTNTNLYKDGTADNPVSTLTAAKTIADSLGMKDFHVTSNSTITLLADLNGYNMHGIGYTLNTAGYDLAGTHILHASTITGTITTAGSADHWDALDATIDVVTADNAHLQGCIFIGTYTFGTSGIVSPEVNMIHCMSGIAGASSPVFTKTPGATLTWSVRDWKGGMTVNGLEAGDTVTIGGGELGTITLNGADANVEVRGIAKAVANNLTGSPTVNLDGVVIAGDVAEILADTGTNIPAQITARTLAAADYFDVTTDRVTANSDQIAGSAPAATNLSKSALGIEPGAAITGTLSTTQMTTDLTETTDGHYIGRVIIWTSGNLANQGTDITGYTGASKLLTYTSTTGSPANGDTFVIV